MNLLSQKDSSKSISLDDGGLKVSIEKLMSYRIC